jgi:predicted house-cleaning noncanonical NTP pyrophosphatase (MazG superfamily)
MRYNKLVRDRIPEIIKKNGGKPKTHIADDEEYWIKLRKKLREELRELVNAETDKERAEEFADVQEVLDAMFAHLGLKRRYVKYIKEKKAKENGQFKKRIILEKA